NTRDQPLVDPRAVSGRSRGRSAGGRSTGRRCRSDRARSTPAPSWSRGLHLPVPLIDGAGPRIEEGRGEPAELQAAKMPFVDPDDLKAAAVTLGWTRLELARTAIGAVTAAELDP